MKILVTGSAGFIGFHTAKHLLERGDEVIGFDNFCPYYEVKLKEARNKMLEEHDKFTLVRGNLENWDELTPAFDALGSGPDTRVLNLAAQAGVRHSIENPGEFIQSNIVGFHNVIELCKQRGVGGLIYASSSSIYGDNAKIPFEEADRTDTPVSLYGMTKKENEIHAYAYHHLFGLNSTGLRFFTVYGPWGRPDMALFIFTRAILEGSPLPVFGEGKMQRDFTYIDDIVSGVVSSLDKNYPYEIFNLGGNKTEELMDYIANIEKALGKKGEYNFMPMQPGDVVRTVADVSKAMEKLDFDPQTHIDEGIPKFIEWYRSYYNVN